MGSRAKLWLPGLTLITLVACKGGASEDDAGDELGDTQATGDASDTGETGGPDPALCQSTSVPVLDGPGAQTLELVAAREDIPGLAEQPTTRGQILGALAAFDGRLHLGYGDYSDNTGPIPMHAYDPGQAAFVDLGVLPTEEVLWFRPGLGTLYSPAVDPDGHQEDGGVYRLDCGTSQWQVGTPIPGAVHVYDVARQGSTIYVGTGSLTNAPALLMASEDHGQSWTELLRRESPADRFSRFYFVGATEQLLFVSGRDHPSPSTSFAWIREGDGAFEALAEPPDNSLVPITLGEDLVIANFVGSPGRGSYLSSYRVEGLSFVSDNPWPTLADESSDLVNWTHQGGEDGQPARLIVLMEDLDGGVSVQRSGDIGPEGPSWEELATLEPLADDRFVSMALLFNDLYLGTQTGSLYVLRELEQPA